MADLFRRYVRYPLEAVIAVLLYGFFAVLPLDVASAVGGWLGRMLGPLMPVSRRAVGNLSRAMPELLPAEAARIVRGMWDNLGRVAAEYPHIERIARLDGAGRMEIVNGELLDPYKEGHAPCVLFSGHLSNWELFAPALRNYGVAYAQVYRAPNNPLVQWLIRRLRRLPEDKQVPKGAQGARALVGVLRNGGQVGMLVDQKLNDGIAVPFFGRPAMTPPAAARLALKFGCPIVPTRMERLGGCHFRTTIYPPMEMPTVNDTEEAVYELTGRANDLLEGWIRERPQQWLWLHRRWPE